MSSCDVQNCFEFSVTEFNDEIDNNVFASTLAFIVGCIIGMLICFVLVRTCCRTKLLSLIKSRRTNTSKKKALKVERKKRANLLKNDSDQSSLSTTDSSSSSSSSSDEEEAQLPVKSPKKKVEKNEDTKEELPPPSNVNLFMPNLLSPETSNFSDVLALKTNEEAEKELVDQDMYEFAQVQYAFYTQRSDSAVQLLRILLQKRKAGNQISKSEVKKILFAFDDSLRKSWDNAKKDHIKRFRAVQSDPKYKGKILELGSALDAEQLTFFLKIDKDFTNNIEQLKPTIVDNSDLHPSDADEIILDLQSNIGKLNRLLADEQLRQSMLLKEKLYKRQYKASVELLQNDTFSNNADPQLAEALKLHGLSQANVDRIMAEYSLVNKEREQLLEKQFEAKRQQLLERLRLNRRKQEALMEKDHAQEAETFLIKNKNIDDGEDFMSMYNDMLKNQRDDARALSNQLDDEEQAEIQKLKKEVNPTQNVKKALYALKEKQVIRSDISIDSILSEYSKINDSSKSKVEQQRYQQAEHLREKLSDKLQKMKEESAMIAVEQHQVLQEQENAASIVMRNLVTLSDDDKDKMLVSFNNQQQNLNASLQLNKLRQKRKMEQKIAHQKALIGLRKVKHADDIKKAAPSQVNALIKEQANDISRVEEKIEQFSAEEERTLRDKLAEETRQIVKSYDEEFSRMVGKLTAENARRRAMIARQQTVLKVLQERLLEQITAKASNNKSLQIDEILSNHASQVESVKQQHASKRDQQYEEIKKRIEAKKRTAELELKAELEAENRKESKQKKGSAIQEFFLRQQHDEAMQRLQKDYSGELKRQASQLQAELDVDLQKKLESNKKQFISKLAIIADLSNDDIIDAVSESVTGTSMNEDAVNHDLHKAIKKARRQMQSYEV